ncbi:bifunctional 2',3'-cyclic-nucleotide 2'-phosphodiesterase/3'-nucleotidase [Bacillus gobiensis]|uniref:bifunctional 2',3'-cyclic-nucleotide 2'-phosphodiesterase/3'-nucleotidase n=1 Tax=Bacillus gobiensis TaxID=1441095 RepID=UPI003D24D472
MVGKTKGHFGWRKALHIIVSFALIASFFLPGIASVHAEENAGNSPEIDMQILGTTDIHSYIMDYDYYSDKAISSSGLARTAELIAQHRAQYANTLLVDNGDLIQGNPLGEYAVKKMSEGIKNGSVVHPIIDVMNKLNYDAGTLGNHEFNYGLDFLEGTLKGAKYPIVNANVLTMDGKHKYEPYKIVEKTFKDKNGNEQKVKVGYTGFVPPQILTWDKQNLQGKVQAEDIKKAAEKVVPEMKAKGADIIVALAHTGIEKTEQPEGSENMVFDLSKVDGIDAIVSGHQHGRYPDPKFTGVNGFDVNKGTINGVPVVMPKNWGSHLGVIDLKLKKSDNKWTVADSSAKIEAITGVTTSNKTVTDAISDPHNKTLEYVRTPVGKTEADINSFFAQVKDDPSIQIVTDAQKWFAEKEMKDTQYKDLPVLSAGAPFKAGGRNGADYYTNIKAGNLAIKNVGDLYLYDNTLYVVKLKGSEVKQWLEASAKQFNQIDPKGSNEQALINPDFPSYNFDVIDGVTYQIDVTKPVGERITNLKYNEKAVDPNQEFLIATNNYRASGGANFPFLTSDKVVLSTATENRQVLIDYITEKGTLNPAADNNWSIAPIKGANVTFESSLMAKEFADKADDVDFVKNSETSGLGVYKLNSDGVTEPPEEDDTWDLTVMHTNDTHAHVDNAARRLTKVNDVRAQAKNSILLDAGDVFSGNLYFTKWNGLADLKFMNMMGYDAMTFGNHEFDKGPKVLSQFIKGDSSAVDPNNTYRFEAPAFPFVSANVDVSKDPDLKGFLREPATLTAGEKKDPGIYPYILLDVNGEKVAVFGLTTEDTASISSPGPTIKFNEATAAAEKTVKEIQDNEKINKIIALSHLGYERDLELADKVKGIDLIVGGHTHTKVEELKVVENEEPTVVVQANEWGKFLGTVDVAFDKNGVVKTDQSDMELLPIDENVPEDTEAKGELDELKTALNNLKTETVGKTDVALDGERNHVRRKETNLGNLIADGMLDKAKANGGADLVITNGGGIRASIDKGDISLGEVLTVMPFGNTLSVVELTGAQVKEALEHGISSLQPGSTDLKGMFPQVAGASFTYTLSKEPGQRLLDVQVKDKNGNLIPIDEKKTYKVATLSFMASGGDGYSIFTEGKETPLGFSDYEVFVEKLQKGTVAPEVEGRINEVLIPKKTDGVWTFDDAAFEDYVKNANDVIFDLTGTEEDKNIELKLTADQVKLLKEYQKFFTIRNDLIGMEVPVSELRDEEALIKIGMTEQIDEAITNVYDFSITQGKDTISEFSEPVGLFFRIDPNKATEPSIYFVNREKEELTEIESMYEEDVVYGYVDHLSEYAVFNKPDDSEQPVDNEPNDPGDGNDPGNGNDPGGDNDPGNGNKPGDDNDSDNDNTPGNDDNSGDDNSDNSSDNGNQLPSTATTMYTMLAIGIAVLLLGAVMYFYQRRQAKTKEL